jgi:hypothetical protein
MLSLQPQLSIAFYQVGLGSIHAHALKVKIAEGRTKIDKEV